MVSLKTSFSPAGKCAHHLPGAALIERESQTPLRFLLTAAHAMPFRGLSSKTAATSGIPQ